MTIDPKISNGAQAAAAAPEAAEVELLKAELERHRRAARQAAEVCRAAAHGDLEARVLRIDVDGELGEMLHGINQMLDLTDAFVREASAALEHASAEKFYRRVLLRGMRGSFIHGSKVINEATDQMASKTEALSRATEERHQLADSFEEAIKGFVDTVASSSTELRATAESLTSTADLTTQKVQTVRQSAGTATQNTEGASASTRKMSDTVREIAAQISQTRSIADSAVDEADRTNATVSQLAEGSQRIDGVLNLITNIASQTRLLALNATIEAARAGEAGKGFAVVANEVKELASQTATATEEIGEQIAAMQSSTGDAVAAIEDIGDTIRRMSGTFSGIATGVDELHATGEQIGESVGAATNSAYHVSETIDSVGSAAEETSAASKELLEAAGSLSENAERLRDEVDQFLGSVRAG